MTGVISLGCVFVGDYYDFVLVFLAVLKQRREADAALFSELHRKLQTQVGIWCSYHSRKPGLITFLILFFFFFFKSSVI